MSTSTGSSKSVVQMTSVNGDEPPRGYVVEGGVSGSGGEIPIVDVGVFLPSSSPEPEVLDFELAKLRSALANQGCFQAIGHGVSSSVLDRIRQFAKEFFELPDEEKLRHSPLSDELNKFQGYGNDVVVSQNQVLDWNYRLFLRVLPRDSRKLVLWPVTPDGFR